jgi:hypothetical protein
LGGCATARATSRPRLEAPSGIGCANHRAHVFTTFVLFVQHRFTLYTTYTTTRSTQLITSGPGDPVAKYLLSTTFHHNITNLLLLPRLPIFPFPMSYHYYPNIKRRKRRYGHVSLSFFTFSRHDTLTAENIVIRRLPFSSGIPQ